VSDRCQYARASSLLSQWADLAVALRTALHQETNNGLQVGLVKQQQTRREAAVQTTRNNRAVNTYVTMQSTIIGKPLGYFVLVSIFSLFVLFFSIFFPTSLCFP
jgi:hypothetical protein